MRSGGPSRLPGPDHLGWWVGVAVLVAVGLHVLAFLMLGRLTFALGFEDAEWMRTAPISAERVEVLPPEPAAIEPELVPEPAAEAASLLEEIDVLAALPENTEVEISPEVIDPEFAVKPEDPLAEGVPEALEIDPAEGFDFDSELPEMGRTEDSLPPAAEGQVVVDPGAVEVDDPLLDEFTDQILKRGAGGDATAGTLDGVVSLDDLVGLPEDALVGKKTMLPSDLLFEYNSAELRESARVGLMKLALLIERNPKLNCWIEGHTDLFGGDEFNLDLSQRRAEAVKSYLVGSLRLDDERILTRGVGERQPIVPVGSIEEQALNRRVEIKMRRGAPPEALPPARVEESPPEPAPAPRPEPTPQPTPPPEPEPEPPLAVEEPEESPPKAIVVKPRRDPDELDIEDAPKARVVEEDPPRARPVEDPPRAVPVE